MRQLTRFILRGKDMSEAMRQLRCWFTSWIRAFWKSSLSLGGFALAALAVKVTGVTCARVPGRQGARVPGCQGARVPGRQGARVPGCHGARVLGCLGATVPGC